MNYLESSQAEVRMQESAIKECELILSTAPEGSLFIRPRKRSTSYYQIYKKRTDNGWKNIEINITNQPDLILALTEKRLAEEQLKICRCNLKHLTKLTGVYEDYSFNDIVSKLPPKYEEAWKMHLAHLQEEQRKAGYIKAPTDPERHIHATTCGILVRSKSEVIIANLLYSYGIPFHYEERFPYPDEDGKTYYPDFTIPLPDGRKLYWEHLGLLVNKAYCIHNAEKLHHYQLNGLYIGKNLIITQDDSEGNCNSAFTDMIIRNFILPHFE